MLDPGTEGVGMWSASGSGSLLVSKLGGRTGAVGTEPDGGEAREL